MKEKTLNQVLLTSGMVALLLLALIFDLILKSLVERNSTQGGLEQLLVWLFPLLQLLWMVAAISLIWLMISGGGYNRLISVLFIIVGLLILYSTSLLFILPVPESFYSLIDYLSPGTFLYQASGALAAIGIFSLAMWKPGVGDELEDEDDLGIGSTEEDEVEEEGVDPASSSTNV